MSRPDLSLNETAGWEEWYAAHAATLLLYARQWCRNASDAEDALQEGFVGFWRRRHTAQDPTAYLYTCVRNAARGRVRRDARRRQREERFVGQVHAAANGLMLENEREEIDAMLREALDQLPEPQREVVVLKIWGRLTFEQIGEVTATSPHTAASRYRYALSALQKTVPEECRP